MDLETILIDNVHVPYLLSWFDGNITNSYFINNLFPVTIEFEILKINNSAITDMCIRKYKQNKHKGNKFAITY